MTLTSAVTVLALGAHTEAGFALDRQRLTERPRVELFGNLLALIIKPRA